MPSPSHVVHIDRPMPRHLGHLLVCSHCVSYRVLSIPTKALTLCAEVLTQRTPSCPGRVTKARQKRSSATRLRSFNKMHASARNGQQGSMREARACLRHAEAGSCELSLAAERPCPAGRTTTAL